MTGSTIVAFLGFLVLGFGPRGSVLFQRVQGPAVAAVLTVSLVMPLSVYLDVRSWSDDIEWRPETLWWLVAAALPFVNMVTGTAYSFRRRVAASDATPSPRWKQLLAVTLALWLLLYPLEYGLPPKTISRPVRDGLALVGLFASVAMPTAVLLDAIRVRQLTDWSPEVRAYVPGTALPFVTLLVAPLYLYRRRQAVASDDRSGSS